MGTTRTMGPTIRVEKTKQITSEQKASQLLLRLLVYSNFGHDVQCASRKEKGYTAKWGPDCNCGFGDVRQDIGEWVRELARNVTPDGGN